MTESPPPGWYADPQGSGQRWWDGARWTDHVQGIQPAVTGTGDARTWAMAAHLSAFVSAWIGLAFIGPLVVYLVKRDEDPFVRRHAAEALNFNLSVLIYAVVGGIVLLISLVLIVGVVLVPFAVAAGIAWIVLVIVAAVKASKGEEYRYPFTIRFVD
jgi:uncharacterized Tic20 family protein